METQINWANDYEINESLKEIGTSVVATAIRIMSKIDESKDKSLYEKLDKESNDVQDFLNSEKFYATEEEANKAVDGNEEISKERVQCRVIKNGHDVSESTIKRIKRRFEQSFKDLDMFYKHYDLVEVYDNSINNSPITKLLRIEKGELAYVTPNLPEYLKERIPKICDEYYLYHTGKKEVGKTM